jgi:hypothetical protein
MKTDPCRFCRLYALALAPIAALLALLLCWQISMIGAFDAVGVGRPPQRVPTGDALASVLRSVAPATTGSALLIALVAWAHPLSDGAFKTDLAWVLKRGAVVTPAGYLAAALVGGVVARLLGASLFGIPAHAYAIDAQVPRELAWGLIASGIDAAIVSFVAWRFLGILRGMRLSLAGKLVVACSAVLPFRAVVGLILESLLPG